MYNTSAAFKTAMAQPSRELTARGTITFPDATTHALTPTEISKFTITENAGDHLPLGGASASTLTLILDNRLGEWNPGGSILGEKSLGGAEVELEIGVMSSEYSNVGVFVIEKPLAQEQDAIITLKGSDYLGNKALTAFSDALTYPQTVLQILQSACSRAGITLKTTTFISSAVSIHEKPLWGENTTCRDIISYVSCLAGGFARIDRNGELEIITFANQTDGPYAQLLNSSFDVVDGELIWTHADDYTGPDFALVGVELFTDQTNVVRLNNGQLEFIGTFDGTNYYIHPNRYKRLTNQGVMFGPLNALSVYEHGAPASYGATRIADDLDIEDNELNSVAVQGNPILAYQSTASTSLMTNMLNSLSGLSYYAASIDWQGDPSITCGDMVTISNLKSEAYPVLVLSQTLVFDNGFSMVTGNKLNTKVIGKAKTENLRVFTPTGKLNAAALDGDINIRAGRKLNLLALAEMLIKAGGKITIEAGGDITVSAGGKVDFSTDDFSVKNSAGNSMLAIQDLNGAASGGGQIVIGSPEMPMKIGGGFVLPVENGGTGSTTNRVWWLSSYPQNTMGADGDLAVMANAPDQSGSYSEVTASVHSTSGNATFAGLARNWNDLSVSGYVRAGNGNATGQTNLKAAVWAFTAPANLSAVPLTFNSVKFISPNWYGWSTSLPITVAIVNSSGTILGRTTFVPGTASQANSVSVPAAVTASTVYYIIMYDAGTSASKSVCLINSVKIPAYAGNSVQYSVALFVKSFGMWTLVTGGNG